MSDKLAEVWADVRSDKKETHWLVVKPSDDFKTLMLYRQGTSGIDEFRSAFSEGGILYGGFRARALDVTGQTGTASITSVRAKFIRVNCISGFVNGMTRAKAQNLRSQVDDLFCGTHCSFDVTDLDELTNDYVIQRLQEVAGAHKPNSYEFNGSNAKGGEVPSEETKEEEPVADTIPTEEEEGIPSEAKPEEAATPVLGEEEEPTLGEEAPAKTETAPAPTPAAEPPTGEPPKTMEEAWRRIMNDNDALNWVMLTYDGKKTATAQIFKTGNGGLDEFKAALVDDLVIYGAFRCKAIDDRGSVKSVRSKFVFVQYIGNAVKPMIRAQAGHAKAHFEGILTGTHISIAVSDAADISEDDLVNRLQLSCGAHRPNGYDFSGK